MDNKKIYRIIAAVADTKQVTFYTEDGNSVVVRQGDSRLSALMDQVTPILARNEVAVIELDSFSVYADFEKKTGGLVKFFRTAKKTLASLIGLDVTKQVVIVESKVGQETSQGTTEAVLETEVHEDTRDEFGGKTGVAKIREQVVAPLKTIPDDAQIQQDEIVVAVIDGIVIPDIDKLKPYIAHALKHNSEQAVVNFLRRVAAIIQSRVHSAVDLMRFLEQADMPLADDGSIIAYKVLNRRGQEGCFVDCHSGRVTQRVGSYVCVDESLVDTNRRNECSNGLHIARRGYLRSFSGDVCVLTKIAPEDVMVVPHGDPNKVRVKGYHIIGEVSKEDFQALRDNRPMTERDGANRMVARAIKGEHVARLEEVRIHGQKGAGVVVTPLLEGGKPAPTRLTAAEKKNAVALDAVQENKTPAAPVPLKEINRRANEEIVKAKAERDAPATAAPKPAEKKAAPKTRTEAKTPVSKAPKAAAKSKAPVKPKTVVKPPVEVKATTTATVVRNENDLSPEHKKALTLIRLGVSQSEASRQTGVPRRTIGRLTDRYGTVKPS